jgi:S-formylglutathione hydrolase FrmB
VLAGASTFTLSASFAGGFSIAGHSADTRSSSTPATVRPDRFDASLSFGGPDDPSAALPPRDYDAAHPSTGLATILASAFELPADVARTRDGRTRAPPQA